MNENPIELFEAALSQAIFNAKQNGLSEYQIAGVLESKAFITAFLACGGNGSPSIGPDLKDTSIWIDSG